MIAPGKTAFPMQGVEIRNNEKNGFMVFQLHYHADPEKRDPNYIKSIKEAMPVRTFKQEYELQWDSFEGLAVFADWDIGIHGVKGDIQPEIGLPLLLGFDFGLTPACIVCQMQEDTLCCLKEFTAINMGTERFMAWMVPQLKTLYHQWYNPSQHYICFIDPAGMQRAQDDEGTSAKVIDSYGFTQIIPGPISWEERKISVEHFLTRRTRNGPCFKVSVPNCPILTRGFQGGYRYDDGVLDKEPNKLRPRKDGFSHIADSLQMVTSRILITKPSTITSIPALSYFFGAEDRDEARGFQN